LRGGALGQDDPSSPKNPLPLQLSQLIAGEFSFFAWFYHASDFNLLSDHLPLHAVRCQAQRIVKNQLSVAPFGAEGVYPTGTRSWGPRQAFYLNSQEISSERRLFTRLNPADLQSGHFQSICALFSKLSGCIAWEKKKKKAFSPPPSLPRALHFLNLHRDRPLPRSRPPWSRSGKTRPGAGRAISRSAAPLVRKAAAERQVGCEAGGVQGGWRRSYSEVRVCACKAGESAQSS